MPFATVLRDVAAAHEQFLGSAEAKAACEEVISEIENSVAEVQQRLKSAGKQSPPKSGRPWRAYSLFCFLPALLPTSPY